MRKLIEQKKISKYFGRNRGISYYEETSEKVIIDSGIIQQELIEKIEILIQEQKYTGIFLFCGNFILGINKEGLCIPCIPECYIQDGKVLDRDNLNTCYQATNDKFDTRFSYFSLDIGLKLYKKLNIETQFLLSADDKYIPASLGKSFLRKGYKAIPEIYRQVLEKEIPETKKHLSKCIGVLSDAGFTKQNNFLLSERSLVRGFQNNKKREIKEYTDYYNDLHGDVTSCSLELFHLLEIIKQQKVNIFKNVKKEDKIGVIMFIPDACTSSALQGGLAVSKTNKYFEIINVTQVHTNKGGVMTLTRISQGGVERL